MIALIQDENGVVLGQLTGHGLPIVEGAEQAVQYEHRLALPKFFVVQFHAFSGCCFGLRSNWEDFFGPRKQQYLQGQGCSFTILGRIFDN